MCENQAAKIKRAFFSDNLRQYCLIPSESAMILLIESCADVKSIFALLSQKVTKAKANFIKITLTYHVPDGANVPQVPTAPRVTSGTLGTWYADLLYKRGNTGNIGSRCRNSADWLPEIVLRYFLFCFPKRCVAKRCGG